LNKERLGIHDNFFDMGGNSLGIIQVNMRMKEVFKRDIPPLVMFEHPTISSLIAFIEKNENKSASATKPGSPDRTVEKSKGKERMKQRRMKSNTRRNEHE